VHTHPLDELGVNVGTAGDSDAFRQENLDRIQRLSNASDAVGSDVRGAPIRIDIAGVGSTSIDDMNAQIVWLADTPISRSVAPSCGRTRCSSGSSWRIDGPGGGWPWGTGGCKRGTGAKPFPESTDVLHNPVRPSSSEIQ
jgi:hypothetical protein